MGRGYQEGCANVGKNGGFVKRERICYVLPVYDPRAATHFSHLYEFISQVSSRVEVFLIVERWRKKPDFPCVRRVYLQKFSFFPLRIAEMFCALLVARLSGFKTFYVHYTYFGVILSSIVARLTSGVTFYWNCGTARECLPGSPPKEKGVRYSWNLQTATQALTTHIPLAVSLRLCTYLVTGTQGMGEYYSKCYGLKKKKIRIMPNWINPARFPPSLLQKQPETRLGFPASRKIVLFVHRLSERKGANRINNVAMRVVREIPDVLFVVVGDGPYEGTLRREVTENSMQEVVKLAGSVPNNDIISYYSSADVFIMPSNEEGFPHVLLEAMAVGIPFVATGVGGVGEIVEGGQKEFVVAGGNMEEFAKKVILLLKSPGKRNDLRKVGLEVAQKYSLERVVDIFVRDIVRI
jgi:glycosyltransferase involved in cell wall biosynthesis